MSAWGESRRGLIGVVMRLVGVPGEIPNCEWLSAVEPVEWVINYDRAMRFEVMEADALAGRLKENHGRVMACVCDGQRKGVAYVRPVAVKVVKPANSGRPHEWPTISGARDWRAGAANCGVE